MSDQSVLFPKWLTHGGITLAKGQLGNSYTFWIMSILIFSPVANFAQQSIIGLLAKLGFSAWSPAYLSIIDGLKRSCLWVYIEYTFKLRISF